jgi:hypothetical protein
MMLVVSMATLSQAFVVAGCRRDNAGSPLHIEIFGMTDKKPEPTTPPRPPLVLPPNGRDVTAEKVGTVIGIIGGGGCRQPQRLAGRGGSGFVGHAEHSSTGLALERAKRAN